MEKGCLLFHFHFFFRICNYQNDEYALTFLLPSHSTTHLLSKKTPVLPIDLMVVSNAVLKEEERPKNGFMKVRELFGKSINLRKKVIRTFSMPYATVTTVGLSLSLFHTTRSLLHSYGLIESGSKEIDNLFPLLFSSAMSGLFYGALTHPQHLLKYGYLEKIHTRQYSQLREIIPLGFQQSLFAAATNYSIALTCYFSLKNLLSKRQHFFQTPPSTQNKFEESSTLLDFNSLAFSFLSSFTVSLFSNLISSPLHNASLIKQLHKASEGLSFFQTLKFAKIHRITYPKPLLLVNTCSLAFSLFFFDLYCTILIPNQDVV